MKILPELFVSSLLPLVISLSATSAASAFVLQLDFGPTTPTGANLTNSPYHSVLGGSESTWNVLGTTDSSSLFYGDGTAATGVAIDLGSSANNDLINFANQPGSNNALGVRINDGVFSGNSVGRDGIFHGSSGEKNVIGLKITGLDLGIYDIFMVGINTNITPNAAGSAGLPQNMGALATTNVGTLDIASLSSALVSNYETVSDPDAANWIEGTNFARFSVTLTADNPVLTLFTVGNDDRGFLNSVQVTVIPEPSTYALISGFLAIGFLTIRRFRKKK